MKLPKGWQRMSATSYEGQRPEVYKVKGEWYAKRDVWDDKKDDLGPFRTAREAFLALGVEVK